jgi:hypothetical protein
MYESIDANIYSVITLRKGVMQVSEIVNDCELCVKSYDDNMEGFEAIKVDNAECFYRNQSGVVDVVFRGSDSFCDLFDAANFTLSPFYTVSGMYGGRVHTGFLQYYMLVRTLLFSRIKDFLINDLHEDKAIRFSGHSLGGCVAICALDTATYIATRQPSTATDVRVTCTIFGSPKIGDDVFCYLCARFVKDMYHIQNVYDIVPSFPPFSFALGHPGQSIYLCATGLYGTLRHPHTSLFSWLYRAFHIMNCKTKMKAIYSLNPHSLDTYLKYLRTIAVDSVLTLAQ